MLAGLAASGWHTTAITMRLLVEQGLPLAGAAEADGEASLEFSVAAGPVEGDEVVENGGATVFLDELAASVLADQKLDVEAHGDHYHFSLGDQDE